ncbi:TIGR02281 family clan AA aspartic protease [Sphingomonas sp.]|uniref:retropepsin-like aspartic protease family protein n=1 Tax=Sphingomonas sp. TaxID=28214 RepID=UPI00286E263D|nr:TIGR02281 family clan AA aspartic protease [Sphingomonas sp.]
MARAYLIVILIGGLFGAMLPSGPSSRPDQADSAAPGTFSESSSARLAARRADSSSGSSSSSGQSGVIELRREGNGHFYADAQINGQNVRFLVDTGATGIALTRDDARRAGLGVSIGMPTVVGQGAAGEVRGEFVTLDRVSLGGTTAERMPAIVLDTGGQSLLGQSFLSRFASVEIRGDTMVLR